MRGWSCCCSWRFGRWRTAEGGRLGGQEIAATFLGGEGWAVGECKILLFWGNEEVSKEWRATAVGADAGGCTQPWNRRGARWALASRESSGRGARRREQVQVQVQL